MVLAKLSKSAHMSISPNIYPSLPPSSSSLSSDCRLRQIPLVFPQRSSFATTAAAARYPSSGSTFLDPQRNRDRGSLPTPESSPTVASFPPPPAPVAARLGRDNSAFSNPGFLATVPPSFRLQSNRSMTNNSNWSERYSTLAVASLPPLPISFPSSSSSSTGLVSRDGVSRERGGRGLSVRTQFPVFVPNQQQRQQHPQTQTHGHGQGGGGGGSFQLPLTPPASASYTRPRFEIGDAHVDAAGGGGGGVDHHEIEEKIRSLLAPFLMDDADVDDVSGCDAGGASGSGKRDEERAETTTNNHSRFDSTGAFEGRARSLTSTSATTNNTSTTSTSTSTTSLNTLISAFPHPPLPHASVTFPQYRSLNEASFAPRPPPSPPYSPVKSSFSVPASAAAAAHYSDARPPYVTNASVSLPRLHQPHLPVLPPPPSLRMIQQQYQQSQESDRSAHARTHHHAHAHRPPPLQLQNNLPLLRPNFNFSPTGLDLSSNSNKFFFCCCSEFYGEIWRRVDARWCHYY